MRYPFEPQVTSKERVGEMLDRVLENAEGARLQHWIAAEIAGEGETKPGQEYAKACKEFDRLKAAVVAWKAEHLGGEA